MAALIHSEQSAARFADEVGVSVHTLRYWKRKLEREGYSQDLKDDGAEDAGPTFLEVSAAMVAPTEEAIEIALADGTVIRVPPAFDDDRLRRVLLILGHGR